MFSNATYDLTNRMVQVESAQAGSQAGWCENYLEVELNANNYFMIQVGAQGNPVKRYRADGKPHGGVKPPLVVEPKRWTTKSSASG